MNDKPKKECCTCRYWTRDREAGKCRRHAPSMTVCPSGEQYTLVIPSTGANDWCGEWEAQEN